MALNAEWHQAHRMPKNATFEQRVQWHAEHVQNCDCRQPSGEVLAELQARGLLPKG